MRARVGKVFLVSVASMLVVTAAAKLYSATGTARILSLEDPILHMNNRLLLAVMGIIEAVLAVYLWRVRGRGDPTRPTMAVLWLASCFMVYRLGIHFMGVRVCPCLGTLSAKLPLPPAVVNGLLTGFVLYCAAGSALLLYFGSRRSPGRAEERGAAGLAVSEAVADQSAETG